MAYEMRPNQGSMFANEQKQKDTHPDEEGRMMFECPHCHASFWGYLKSWWKQTRDGKKFQSLSFKVMDGAPGGASAGGGGGGRPNYGNRGGGGGQPQFSNDDRDYDHGPDDRGYDDRGDHQRPMRQGGGGGYRR